MAPIIYLSRLLPTPNKIIYKVPARWQPLPIYGPGKLPAGYYPPQASQNSPPHTLITLLNFAGLIIPFLLN